jgi:N utilization substance protein B
VAGEADTPNEARDGVGDEVRGGRDGGTLDEVRDGEKDGAKGAGGEAPRARPRKRSARSRGRRRALDVLFEADQRGLNLVALGDNRLVGEGPALEFARALVGGVAAHLDEIDETVETYSLGWPLARMPSVDRAIARLGAYEILFTDVPDPVVLGEAADMAGDLSTAKSANFLSGVLGWVSAMKPAVDG